MFISVHDQLGLKRTRSFHALEDRHHVSRAQTERVEGGGHLLNGGVIFQDTHSGALLLHVGLRGIGHDRITHRGTLPGF